jgi:hypothetical protein
MNEFGQLMLVVVTITIVNRVSDIIAVKHVTKLMDKYIDVVVDLLKGS